MANSTGRLKEGLKLLTKLKRESTCVYECIVNHRTCNLISVPTKRAGKIVFITCESSKRLILKPVLIQITLITKNIIHTYPVKQDIGEDYISHSQYQQILWLLTKYCGDERWSVPQPNYRGTMSPNPPSLSPLAYVS